MLKGNMKQIKITNEEKLKKFTGEIANIKKLKIKNVVIDIKEIDIFNNFLSKLSYDSMEKLNCKISTKYHSLRISVKKINNDFVYKLKIEHFDDVKTILDNLPIFITQLKIDLSDCNTLELNSKKILDIEYSNLPFTLKKLNVKFPFRSHPQPCEKLQKETGIYNILFCFKIPFGLVTKVFDSGSKKKYLVNFNFSSNDTIEFVDYYLTTDKKYYIIKKTFFECPINYVFLDSEERSRFARVGYQQLLQQLQP
jgi:hypothetical protein